MCKGWSRRANRYERKLGLTHAAQVPGRQYCPSYPAPARHDATDTNHEYLHKLLPRRDQLVLRPVEQHARCPRSLAPPVFRRPEYPVSCSQEHVFAHAPG
ncbi:unnamed protein product [Ectocarpus sp. 8 AP-2014]